MALSAYRKKPIFPDSLTDLHRFRKSIHGHDGSSRIVMVRKTDQRTYASVKKGEEPKLETITRETIETFRGQRTEFKVTTEKKDYSNKCPASLIGSLERKQSPAKRVKTPVKRNSTMAFQNAVLKAHNEYRQKHGVPPLKLNKKMNEASQTWADHLVKRSALEHSNYKDYGENIYCITSTNPNFTITGNEPVDSWYSEIDRYVFNVEPKDISSGHFTQVVWKESQELGVGYAKTGGKIVVVANYYPPGNVIDHFKCNVPPIGGFDDGNNNINSIFVDGQAEGCERAKSPNTMKNITNGTEGDFEADFLIAHNNYRKRHGVEPLELDQKLCKLAQEWANMLVSRNILEHRKNCPYGQNIYCMYSSDPNFTITGHEPVDTWYEESKSHVFGKEPNSLKSSHFTQVVWKSSKHLGVGVARSGTGKIYVVANYSPPGNFVGHYTENVFPLANCSGGSDESLASECKNLKIFDGDDFDHFQLECLRVHNEYRRKHFSPPMSLNKELCNLSLDWAQICAKNGTLGHRPNNKYGENVFYMFSSDFDAEPSARDVIRHWYDEVQDVQYGKETLAALHFTQVVWKGSVQLGVGMAKNKKGQTFVVANYSPRGNVCGQFVENVQKPRA